MLVRLTTILALLAGLAAPAGAQGGESTTRREVAAEDSALEARTSALASRLRCPVCQGESIQDSPSELAQNMRAVVREQLRAGKSPQEIEAYFVSKYGEWILLEPSMTGLNVLLYVFPVLLVVGGLALVVVLVRRWTAPPEANQG
ncbi:MAG TPA: cytochrome c-type biogenesis protein CcmH [Gemmatimonadaceae bacterium]|nr:cytochrome c-type biogenesis protein CcmH [Gemmatimonadaceae bacterium]